LIQAGMWMERFIIIVTSLNRDFLPSSWHIYAPTWVDWSLLAGSIAFFLLLFLLFLRFVPFIPVSEVKHLRHELGREEASRGGAGRGPGGPGGVRLARPVARCGRAAAHGRRSADG